jgi:molybdopterin synthase catalytic subunit
MNHRKRLTVSPDPVVLPDGFSDGSTGAELIFLGRVRGMENGEPISGIAYTCYESMAVRELERIHGEITAAHGPHDVIIHHRIGFVPNGEASLLIACGSRHSPEAFTLVQAYLRRIKESLPVWKHCLAVDVPPPSA